MRRLHTVTLGAGLAVAIALCILASRPLVSWIGSIVREFDWLLGIERRKDVTPEDRYWGGFKIGAIYRLKHGAYVYDSGNSDVPALNAPAQYGVQALDYAARTYDGIEKIPETIEYSDEFSRRVQGPPPVESLSQGHVPEQFETTIAAGTRLKVSRIIRETAGDRVSFEIRAEILDGPLAGKSINIAPLTNYGFHGFETRGGGYSPNPLILEKVRNADEPAKPIIIAPGEQSATK